MIPKLVHPSTILISGPTGCGKSQFTARLLIESMFEPMPERIMWIYSEWQPLYNELLTQLDIDFIKGFPPNLYESISPDTTNLIILDDQMSSIGDSKTLKDLFTKGSHHRNLTVIYIVQNMYDQGRSMRTTSLNTQYQIVFKSPRDSSQVARLGATMFPNNKRFLSAVFAEVTEEPFGYLLIDLRPETPTSARVRSHIFEGEANLVYVPG